ncbi:MAG: DNA polymerase III subunit alpha [Verrucomicrobia bacterium]|nr:MAG: DNA polymerase III subunit alpha [Verrucomicrobiota bacterium]
MPSPAYIELHTRSAFSFLRGASSPRSLATAAADLGLPALALCDRDGFYGSVRFHTAARECGLRPLVGCELTMEDGSVLPLLVANRTGYQNLARLITRDRLDDDHPAASSPPATAAGPDALPRKRPCRIRWADLPFFSEGLVVLTGDEEGPLLRAWRRGGRDAMEAAARRLLAIFPGPGRLYIEVQRHHIRGEDRCNRALFDLADALRLPLLATNGVNCATPAARAVADVFTCLRHHTHLDAAGTLLSRNAENHLKPARAMAALFADRPDAVANTLRLADSLEFTLENLGYEFPEYPVAPGETMESMLRKLTWFGAEQRYGSITPEIRRQLEHELAIIARLGFCGYFLIVWDLVTYCREHGILVQGRGSAANSAVCYSLGITACDPIGGKLLFERFLSEGRQGWPDIDLDLPSGEKREQVIQEVYRRYGRTGAAMTANVITYRGRSAIREIGKVLGFPEEVLNRYNTLFPHGDAPDRLQLREQLVRAGIPRHHPRADTLATLYEAIRGLPRHLGQHSGGMIICQGRLDSVVPLENAAMPGRSVAQWDKDDCEDMGIVKVDLLGLGMMAVLQDTLVLTRERGRPVDLAHIPRDDPQTFALLQAADTIGVFQVESRAQMATLPRMKPETFYDLCIEVAIIRPGPIQGNLVHPYLARRQGREPVTYIDERLKPVLERTLGVPLFQEQMLKIAMIMADFTGSEAEELRRALSFHRSDERMEKVKVKLRRAMEAKGIAPHVIEEITRAIGSFALYGFPESHAISFALIAYASAWLKVHRAAEFYTALLNNQPMGFYSPATLIQDARRHGLRVRPVDITISDWPCTVEDDHTLRLGLQQVHGIRKSHAEHMLAARAERPFAAIEDFLLRTRFTRPERRALAAVGALNPLGGHRRSALWLVEEDLPEDDLFTRARAADGDRAASPDTSSTRSTPAAPLAPMSPVERLQADYAGMSLTTGTHPMAHFRSRIPEATPAADLPFHRNGERVTIAGAVICRQRPGTARGVVFISLEDETGIANAIVPPELFEKRRLVITQNPFLRISGPVQIHEGVVHVKARRITPLTAPDLPPEASHDFR